MEHRLGTDGQEFFTSYDEVHESFDAMGLQENLLRGIYAYGIQTIFYFLLLFLVDIKEFKMGASCNFLLIKFGFWDILMWLICFSLSSTAGQLI